MNSSGAQAAAEAEAFPLAGFNVRFAAVQDNNILPMLIMMDSCGKGNGLSVPAAPGAAICKCQIPIFAATAAEAA